MKWTEIVINPLGLAAFALALVFGVAGVKLAARHRRWFLPTALALAALVIVGGLLLAYRGVKSKEKNAVKVLHQEKSTEVKQTTYGPDSPAVQGVGGNVSIIQNQGDKEK